MAPTRRTSPDRKSRARAGARRTAGPEVPWHLYVLRCGDGTLYTGIARDVEARLAAHRASRGARYTRGRGPLTLVYLEPASSQSAALKREAAIKRLSKAAKEKLVEAPRKRAR